MKKNWTRYAVMGIIFSAALTVSGCAAVGLFFNDHTYGGRERWEIGCPPGDIVNVIAETGKSMGLEVVYSEVKTPPSDDIRATWIMLSADEMAGLGGIFIGKSRVSGLSFEAREGGKKLEVSVFTAGKFGSGTKKAAMKLLKDFRTNLSRRTGEITVIQEMPGPA